MKYFALHWIAAGHLNTGIISNGDARDITQVWQRADLVEVGDVVLAQRQDLERCRQESVALTQVRNAIWVKVELLEHDTS